jgi:hypothetical protein
MKVRNVGDVVRGRRGKRHWRSLRAKGSNEVVVINKVAYVMEVMTFLLRSMTKCWTRVLRMSGESMP